MATSQDKKRKSRYGERRESREGVKKRKEDGRSVSKSRHAKSSSKSSRSSTTTGRKVRSISELVKLVISGEVQVPKTLGHYVEEREELLDQVFTVLSENDIRGMLPDILKGLRMKEVRQLCLDQLKSMSTEDITEITDPQKHSSKSINLDATVFELLGPQAVDCGAGEGLVTANTHTGSATAHTGSANTHTGSATAHSSSSASPCGGGDSRNERTGDSFKTSVNGGNGQEQKSDLPLRMEVENSLCYDESLKNSSSTGVGVSGGQVREMTSDVSGDEGSGVRAMRHSRIVPLKDSLTQTMECDTTTSETAVEQERDYEKTAQTEEGDVELAQQGDSGSDDSASTVSSSSSSLEDYWLCDFAEEVPESARLQEIEFRRRALEAELRRASQREGEREAATGERDSGGGGREEESPLRMDQEEGEGEDNPPSSAPGKIDKLEAVELQMRQRALQSLLAKKKEQKL